MRTALFTFKTLFLTLWMLLLATAAVADENYATAADIKPGRFQIYLQSNEMLANLNQVGRFWDKLLGLQQACQEQYAIKPVNLIILAPVVFPDAAQYPTAGIWRVQFEYNRCKDLKTYNAIFTAKDGGTPELLPAIPGYSDASPALALDAMRAVTPQVQAQLGKAGAKDCKQIYPFDARMTPTAVARPRDQSWQEKWTFQGCGKQVVFLMTFNPQAPDGNFFSGTPLH